MCSTPAKEMKRRKPSRSSPSVTRPFMIWPLPRPLPLLPAASAPIPNTSQKPIHLQALQLSRTSGDSLDFTRVHTSASLHPRFPLPGPIHHRPSSNSKFFFRILFLGSVSPASSTCTASKRSLLWAYLSKQNRPVCSLSFWLDPSSSLRSGPMFSSSLHTKVQA